MVTIIILYDEFEKDFDTNGLGILKDATSCKIIEKLNDSFELELEYPIYGSNYDKIKIGRIIAAEPNPYDNIQPFRIYSISKPLKGIVTIYAFHISYDMNGIPCKAIDANNLNEALLYIKQNSVIESNFTFKTDITDSRKFKTTAPYNMRAILMGDDKESLLGVYKGEVKFDKYSTFIYSKRGKNRGAKVCYANNMTDLAHESNNDRLYNGVFPYYHSETESTETVSEESFTKAYIVSSKTFQDGWLSFSENGEAYHPVDSTPVQIATEGQYYEKVYSWNNTYQKFEEKIYNETVTLMEGIIEPSWIIIDWSRFPVVTCKANSKGYFKTSTDTDWGSIKGVGDAIFEGNILTSGITNMASNMIIYYSEVIPPNKSSTSETTVTSVDVILDDPIIRIDTTDAKSMQYDRILSLDLTSSFNEEPTKEQLRNKAEEYISVNQIGTAKHTTSVSFVDLSSTTDKDKYKNFNHIELGDTVEVVYKDLGVDVNLRVISTEYNPISKRYVNIELGEKNNTLSGETVQNGDNISSLSNDVGYTDITTVNRLIAKTVSADFIQAANATMSDAQIKYLQAAKIECSGILEASQLSLDNLVARLLVADNAKIAETLEAGNIKVAGDISINSGSININDEDSNTSFIVDRSGNLTANSVEITGGSFSINEGMFEVTNDGIMSAQNAYIEGEINATSGVIGGCVIENGNLEIEESNISGTITANKIEGGAITASEIKLGYDEDTESYNFEVDSYGNVDINSGSINIGEYIPSAKKLYTIPNETPLSSTWCNNDIKSLIPIIPENDEYTVYEIFERSVYEPEEGNISYIIGNSLGYYIYNNDEYEEHEATDGETAPKFSVKDDGNVNINYGDINIGNGNFTVNNQGQVTCQTIDIRSGSAKLDDFTTQEANIFNMKTNGAVNLDGDTYVQGVKLYSDTSESFEYIYNVNFIVDQSKTAPVNTLNFYTGSYLHEFDILFKLDKPSEYNSGMINIDDINITKIKLRAIGYKELSKQNPQPWVTVEITPKKSYNPWELYQSFNATTGEFLCKIPLDFSGLHDNSEYWNVYWPNGRPKTGWLDFEYEWFEIILDKIPNVDPIEYTTINPHDFTIRRTGITKTVYRYLELLQKNMNIYYDDGEKGFFLSSRLTLADSDYECSGILNNISVSATVEYITNSTTYTAEINRGNITFDSNIGYVELDPVYLENANWNSVLSKVTKININPPGYAIEIHTDSKLNLYVENGLLTPKIGHEENPIENIYGRNINCYNLHINDVPVIFGVYSTEVTIGARSIEKILYSSLIEKYECGIDLTNRVVSVTATLKKDTVFTASGSVSTFIDSTGIGIVNNYNTSETFYVTVVYR